MSHANQDPAAKHPLAMGLDKSQPVQGVKRFREAPTADLGTAGNKSPPPSTLVPVTPFEPPSKSSAPPIRAVPAVPQTPPFPPPGTPAGKTPWPVQEPCKGVAQIVGKIEDMIRAHPLLSQSKKEAALHDLYFLNACARLDSKVCPTCIARIATVGDDLHLLGDAIGRA